MHRQAAPLWLSPSFFVAISGRDPRPSGSAGHVGRLGPDQRAQPSPDRSSASPAPPTARPGRDLEPGRDEHVDPRNAASAAGKALGTSTVASGWSENNGLALLVMSDRTLRSVRAPALERHRGFHGAFRREELDAAARGPAGAAPVAESAGIIGATLTKDGQPPRPGGDSRPKASRRHRSRRTPSRTAWSESFLATDAATGAVVLVGRDECRYKAAPTSSRSSRARGPRVLMPPLGKGLQRGA